MRKLMLFTLFLGFNIFYFAPALATGNPAGYSALPTVTHAKKAVLAKPKMVTVRLNPGSIKTNIERLAHDFGWNQIIWQSSDDYNWVGSTEITAKDFPGVLMKSLKGYPLQAVFYQGNHVLVIVPRNPT